MPVFLVVSRQAFEFGGFNMSTIRKLPAPIEITMPLAQVLGRRRSCREFSEEPVDESILSALLWACAGRNSADGRRTAPSALNCREVDCFVFDNQGVWLYDADANSLTQVAEGDQRGSTTIGQTFVQQAPVTLMLAVNHDKDTPLSSGRRGDICRSADVGAMMQNALLACAAMGLAAVPRASFDPQTVLQAMSQTAQQYEPQMAVTVGFAA